MILIYFMICLFILPSTYAAKKRDIVSLKAFGTCEGHEVPNGFENCTTDYTGRGITVINADLLIRVPAKEVVGNFAMMRCPTASRANCEQVLSFPVNNQCERYNETGQYYSAFLRQIKPRYGCPMVLGTHHKLRNGTFDSRTLLPILNKFPSAHGSVWLLRNEVYRKKDRLEVNCVDFLVKVERVRGKPKS